MADEKLHQLLTQVHEHLQQKSSLDEQSQKLLQQVLMDVQNASNGETALQQDLAERIEQQAVQFEQAHPTLAEILRQIMDTLGRIGV
jgi:CBS domain-containing protein